MECDNHDLSFKHGYKKNFQTFQVNKDMIYLLNCLLIH